MKQQLSVFLSHSHKDIAVVRKVRDILELLNCDPIMFYLHCLDDENETLEDFIKKEIDARNIFLYCKSVNSEKSIWVKKELEYIRNTNINRLYTIDIEEELEENLLSVLSQLSILIRYNSILLLHTDQDSSVANKMAKELSSKGYKVSKIQLRYPKPMMETSVWEYSQWHDYYASYFDNTMIPLMKKISEQGVVVVLSSDKMYDEGWNSYMFGKVQHWFSHNSEYKMLTISTSDKVNDIIDKLVCLSNSNTKDR